MKNKTLSILSTTFAGMLLFASLMNANLPRKYRPGDFVKEQNAYFVEEIKDPHELDKAQKFITPTDEEYEKQITQSMGASLIGNIEKAWDSYTGEGVTIAVIDDGFDVNHPEYKRSDNSSAILSTSRYYYSYGNSAYYQSYSNNPSCIDEKWEHDENYDTYEWATHGTATSTTAAAPMNNGGGVGIAPDADLLLIKVDMSWVAVKAAIQYAVDQGVDVINMSLGGHSDTFVDGFGNEHEGWSELPSYLENVCKNAYNAGVIVVAAAGNEATWHKSYPACNYKVVAAGATGDWDNKGNADELAEFTNYVSPTQTGEVNVDILAPGYVWTAQKSGTENEPTHVYDNIQGTSFSSPITAGAAALWKQKNPTGTPDEFLTKLQGSADGIGYYKDKMVPVTGWYPSLEDVGPSNIENGRVNVSNLLDVTPYVNIENDELIVANGKTKQIDVISYSGTLTYASSNTSVATVNNTGLITGVNDGDVTITVTSTVNDQTASKTIDVTVTSNILSVSFNPKSIQLSPGETYDAKETVSIVPVEADKDLMFLSNDESIATVDIETGEISAIKDGTATITVAPLNGDCEDTLNVTVATEITSVEFNPNEVTLDVGETYDAKATVSVTPNTAAKELMFESDREDIATVNLETGEVTAVAAGTAHITVLPVYGSCEDTLTVTVTDENAEYDFDSTYDYNGQGTTWTLSDCSDQTSYWRCPEDGTVSVALVSKIFDGKVITSDVVITINCATYGSGGNPVTDTFKIYKEQACTNQISATKSGTLPTDKNYKDVVYTVSKTNAANFSSDLAIKITKPGKQIRLKSFTVEFSYKDAAPKVIESISASYTGGDVYIDDSLDTSKVTVTASFTDSTYADVVLSNNDYSLTGFSSATTGTKTVTVTYTGSLTTTTSPMTTSFDVTVKADAVTSVTPTVSKTYHPGDKIVKNDILVTLGYESGRTSPTINFTFDDDQYQFTYEDAPSGGSNGQKEFSITYNNNDYNFSVNVSRVASNAPSTSALKGTITGNQAQAAGIKVGTGTSAANYTDIYIGGIKCDVENGYVYSNSGYYLSFGKAAGSIYNKEPLAYPLLSVSISQKSGSRSDAKYYLRTEKGTWTSLGTCDFINNDYRYFKVAFESSSSSYSNISSISLNSYIDTVANVCNYIMYQDTENQCLTKLDVALTRLNTMSNADKSSFWTSNDYVIKTARTRLEAWAVNQGKTLTYSNNSFAISSAKVLNINQLNISFSDYSYLIYILIAGITLGGVMLYFIYRKKRLDK